MVMEIRSEIDPRMKRYVELAIGHAEKTKADYVIVDMDTYGGVLTDAKEIVDLIMGFKKPVWVFINSDAASAGRLSRSPVTVFTWPPEQALARPRSSKGQADKPHRTSISPTCVRSCGQQQKKTDAIPDCRRNGDEKIVIDSVKQAGKVITFTTSEAIAHHYCEAKVQSIEEICNEIKLNTMKSRDSTWGRWTRSLPYF